MSVTLEDTVPPRTVLQNGPAIAVIRELSGWSQNKFAKYVGIGQGTLSDIENEKETTTAPTLNRIARGLRIPLVVISRDTAPCAACAARAAASKDAEPATAA